MVGYRDDQKGAGDAQDTKATKAKVKGAIGKGRAQGPTATPAVDVLQRVYRLPAVPGRDARAPAHKPSKPPRTARAKP